MSSPSFLVSFARHTGALAFGFALIACNGSSTEDPGGGTSNTDSAAGYLYLGACTPSVCADLPVAEIGCTSGQPEYVCSARANGQCAIDVRCPADSSPDGTVSFSPCDESQCGPKPGNPSEVCPSGYAWTSSQCGSLNGAACAWANGCYPPKEPLTVDPSQIGKACGLDVSCDAPESCVTLPRESGVEGAHCIVDPCAAISCPTDRCMILESYPGQVRCE